MDSIKKTPIHTFNKGEPVTAGYVDMEAHVFHKKVKSTNIMKEVNGICFDDTTLEDAKYYGATHVCAHIAGQRPKWCTFGDIKKYGRKCPGGIPNQTLLELQYWHTKQQLAFDI
jgi:hypothetical protein